MTGSKNCVEQGKLGGGDLYHSDTVHIYHFFTLCFFWLISNFLERISSVLEIKAGNIPFQRVELNHCHAYSQSN